MGLLLYPGNRCEPGSSPSVECNPTSYNSFEYTITGATKAYWWRSGDTATIHPITLVDGAATDEIIIEYPDTYIVCAELCSTCIRACCTFDCIEPTAPDCGECIDPTTLLTTTYSAVQVTITDGGVSNGWFPDPPLDGCDAPTCFDLSGTYVVDYCAGYEYCRAAFICTTDDGVGGVFDWYQRTGISITNIGTATLRVLIYSHVVKVVSGDPGPPDDCTDYTIGPGLGPFYSATREWRWLRDDVAITTCDGEEGTLFDSSCLPLELTNTANTGSGNGCSIVANYEAFLDALIP